MKKDKKIEVIKNRFFFQTSLEGKLQCLNLLTLNKQPDISPKNWYIWEKQRIAIQGMQSNDEPHTSPKNKGEEQSFIEERGSSERLL